MNKEFWETGVFYPVKALNQEDLEYFRNSFFEHEKLLDGAIDNTSFAMLELVFPWAYRLVTHPKILEAVKAILGPNVLVHGSNVFHKRPNDQKFVSWHQDSFYLKLNSFEYITAWIALGDSTKENGCLRIIPKTHHSILAHIEQPHYNNLLNSGMTVDVSSFEQEAIDVELKAGEMSLHHANAVHGSNPNVSGQRRIGFAIRYISAKVTQQLYHHKVILAAGEYDGSHYKLLETPPTGTLEECIEKQKVIHDLFVKNRERV